MQKQLITKILSALLVVMLAVSAMWVTPVYAAGITYYSQGTGTANTLANWNTVRGGGGTSPANFTGGDIFVIQNGHTISPNANWTVSGAGAKIQIENGGTLNTNARQINTVNFQLDSTGIYTGSNATGNSVHITAAGTVTLNGTTTGRVYIDAGATTIDGTGSITGAGRIDVSANNNVNINFASTANLTLIRFDPSRNGTITNNGSVKIATITDPGGGGYTWVNAANSTLDLSGDVVPLPNSTLTATAAGNTVIYSLAGAQSIRNTTYNNLTLSGSGAKTLNGNTTVNNILSMQGTATFANGGNTLTYGPTATLQYNTASAITAGAEWLNTFTATGGVVIANTGTITLNANKIFNASVPLTINSGASLNTDVANNRSLTFGGNFVNAGTFTANASPIIIANTMATQSIAGFTTTGLVSMTKTGGTATFTGNVSGAGLTINGTGGTLNLGSGLTHTFSGTWTRTNGTLGGGSSILKIGGSVSGAGGTFTASTGTVEWNAAGNQTIAAVTYNNLAFSGSGAKTMPGGTSVTGNLSIAAPATASVAAGQNLSVGSLTLGGLGKNSGTWGSTSSVPLAANTDNTYFALTTGYLTITNDTRTTPSVTTWPTASGITYSQALSASTLTGGSASVAGSFAFTVPTTIPPAGTYSASVTFTPTDTKSYKTVTSNVNVVVSKISSTVTVTCPATPQTYTGSALTPCTATYSTVDGLNGSLTVTYSNNTNVGTATADATYAGDANHAGSSNSATFAIGQATSSVTVTCPATAQIYTGLAIEPCTATYSTSDGLSGSLTPTYSNNMNVGTATANASYAGDANHTGSSNSATFAIGQATSSVTVTCPATTQIFTGSALTPCTATYLTSDGLSGSLTPTYSNNTNVGTATADATYVGDANHAGNSNSATFAIGQATSSVTVTCPATTQTFTGSALTPCTASYLTSDGLSGSLTPTYSNNTNVGTATADATYSDDANHAGSTNSATFTIGKSDQTISVTTGAPVLLTSGVNFIVAATGGASGNPIIYSATGSCTNLLSTFTTGASGTCVIHYNQAGDANYNAAAEVTENTLVDGDAPAVTINQASGQTDPSSVSPIVFDVVFSEPVSDFDATDVTITGMVGVPGLSVSAGPGTNYTVSVTGMVSGETVTATIAAGRVHDAATNANTPSTSTDNSVLYDTTGSNVTIDQAVGQANPTNVSPINFTVVFSDAVTGFATGDVSLSGTAGATTGIVTEIAPNNGTTYNVAVSGMTSDGTVIASIPAAVAIDSLSNNNLASGPKTITYDATAPQVIANGINTLNDTGDGILAELEVVAVNITQLSVNFSEDVYNPEGDTDPKDVTNPANYLLVRDLGDTADFQTTSCVAGAVVPADTKIDVSGVSYNNATHIATFTINGGLPLSNGNYRLYVCGTTSIIDLARNELNSSKAARSDTIRNFTISMQSNGSTGTLDGNSKKTDKSTPTFSPSGFLIPVTGFAPNQITPLPVQPADKVYKPLDEIRIEIPTLGINFPIVGVAVSKNSWDLTWLQNSVGYLEGSAYPTHAGNSVLSAHVTDASNNLGPFSDIKGMQVGDKIYLHAYGQKFVYQVQENSKILPSNISTVFKHEEYNWVTLVTCEEYNAKTGLYNYRRMVRAILISVVSEK